MSIAAPPRASQFTAEPAGPLPVFGGFKPLPAAPPPGVVADGAGGTGVFVAAMTGCGVCVAVIVALAVGVADRTISWGAGVGVGVAVDTNPAAASFGASVMPASVAPAITASNPIMR